MSEEELQIAKEQAFEQIEDMMNMIRVEAHERLKEFQRLAEEYVAKNPKSIEE